MKNILRYIIPVILVIVSLPGRGDNTAIPGDGWDAKRYETLWTKSPFAVATPDVAPESTDYALVGIAQIDGVSYASLTDKKSNEHFLLASDKPVRGLKLISITSGKDADNSLAVVEKDGKSMSLKLEQGTPPPTIPGMPQQPPPQGAAPVGGIGSVGLPPPPGTPANGPPPVMQRPRIIHIPPPPIQPRIQPGQPSPGSQ